MTTPTPRQIEVAVKAGFAGIEARAERLRGKENAGELEAAVSAVRSGGGKVLSVNGLGLQALPTGALFEAQLEADLSELLDITASLRAPLLLVVPMRAPGVSFEAALTGMREGLARARDAALRYGIGLGFEFLGFGDCPINTPARALAVAEALPDVGFVPDSCHVYASGAGMRDFPVERLRLVHLNDVPLPPERTIEDSDRVLPGEGRIPLERYVRELRDAGFDGPWSLETFNELLWSQDPEQIASRGYESLRTFLA
jgi:2-keto-myo-inositol isomerase